MVLHPQARAAIEAERAEAGPAVSDPGVDLDAFRRGMAAAELAEERPALAYVRDVDADGVRCRLYRPRPGAPLLLYAHGGGWVLGDVDTHDRFTRELALRTGWAVLSVDYRRAPEHPFPAPLDDVRTALAWARRRASEHDVDGSLVVGAGDSSGANLIAGLSVREPGAFATQVLVYPPLDPSGDHPSYSSEDPMLLPATEMRWFWRAYAPDTDARTDPRVAPMLAADLSAMPPTYLLTAEHDILRDEGEAFAARLADAGVRVVAQRALGMTHGFWRRPWQFDAADDAVDQLAAALRRLLSP